MISQRLISRFSVRRGLFEQSTRILGLNSDCPVHGFSWLPNTSNAFQGNWVNLTSQTHLLNNAVPAFLGKLGSKLGFAEANSHACTMSFRSSIHTVGAKEFETRDTRFTEKNAGEFEKGTGTLEMDRNNSGRFEPGWTANRSAGPSETRRNNIGPSIMGPDNRDIGFSSNISRPTESGSKNNGFFGMGLDNRRTEFSSNSSRPTEAGGSNAGVFGLNWSSSRTPGGGYDRNPRYMNLTKGILEENGRGFGGGSQFSRYNVEQNADIVHVKLMRNNTFITVTDSKGNKKMGASAGMLAEMKGGPKVSRYSADATAEHVGRMAKNMGIKSVVIKLNGFTYFKKKKQAVLSFRDGYSNSRTDQNPVVYIEDTTRKPHNGCRLRKKRRV